MRKSIAVAAAVIALSAPASATDFGSGGYAFGQRAGQVVVFDYQPGVIVRAYWSPPWQGRHYFPVTGTIPQSGRHENLNAPRRHYRPAQSFYREWSASSVFELPVADFAQRVPLAAAPPALNGGAVVVPDAAPVPERFEHLPAEK
jgi:hypothetical protein